MGIKKSSHESSDRTKEKCLTTLRKSIYSLSFTFTAADGIQKGRENMVVYLPEGDIFNIEGVTNFAHGCNSAGAMGKGIALAFRNKYPDMYYLYKEYCRCGHFKPGTVFIYFSKGLHTKEGVIFNLGTQRSWKTGSTLEYIRNSLIAMVTMAQDLDIRKIAMPAIGAGLGGLLWSDVKSVIDDVAKDIPSEKITLFVVEKYSSSKKINV